MQALTDMPTTVVSQVEAQRAASAYVAAHIDQAFEVVAGERYHSQPLGRELWRFFIRSTHSALGAIKVDAQTGEVIALSVDQVRMIRERAVIAEARSQQRLAVDDQGYVLAEYARRKANGYLSMEVSLFCSASDGMFIPLTCPIWQFAIRFGLPGLGDLGILSTLDVDAQTGEPVPLTNKQIKRIQERANAIVQFRTQKAAA